MALFREYAFWTVLLGAGSLALAAGMIGSISVLTRQSLIGDSLGHASYPGVLLAFMLFQSRHPLVLMMGAVLAGYASYGLVLWLRSRSQQPLTTVLALVSASFFGLGMVLKQYIQGNDRFSGAAQAGLQTYLFGQAAFIQIEDVWLIAGVSVVCLALFGVYYQQFRLYLFDETFARLAGIKIGLLRQVTMFCLICLIAVGLKVVGAVLMSSFLIGPAVFGLLLGKTYPQVLGLAVGSALFSVFVGTWVSSVFSGVSTGPSMIVCLSLLVLLAFALATYVRKENTRV